VLNIGALALALVWLALIATTISPDVDDFKLYWHAAVNMRQSGDPYATTPEPGTLVLPRVEAGGTLIGPYLYPPLLAYLVQPLAALDLPQAQRVWFTINCLALGSFIWLCIRLSRSTLARRYWGVAVLGVLLAPPTRLCLQIGQTGILIALLLAATYAVQRRAPLAGALLALATTLKLYPGVLGLFYSNPSGFIKWERIFSGAAPPNPRFLFTNHVGLLYTAPRTRRVAWWALASGALIAIGSILVYGLAPYANYLRKNGQSAFYPYAAEFNISLVGFWDRLLSASNYAQPLAAWPGVARAIAAALSVVVVIVCVKAGRHAPDATTNLLQYGAWICGMLLLAPINGYYNLVLLLLPLLAALKHLEQQPDRRAARWLILATALAWFPPGWTDVHPAVYDALHRGVGLLVLTPAIYGLAIYLGLLLWLARRSAAEARR
jgi:hypothetical protein